LFLLDNSVWALILTTGLVGGCRCRQSYGEVIMRIRYAVSTMVFWGWENNLSFEQECLFLHSLGFGVELWPNMKGQNECRYERRNWPRLVEATKDMLVSMRSRSDGPTLDEWNEQIECAKLLDANIVTDLLSLGIRDGSELDNCEFASEVVKAAEENNVKLCLETGNLQTLKDVGKKFESLWYCLDTGYANLDRDFSFRQYVDDLAERVVYLHLSDNYGHMDDHERPGLKGGITRENWEYLFDGLRKYDNDVIGSFEMGPSMPAVMIRQATEFLFDELQWPNRPQKKSRHVEVIYNPV
jgi:sugar phosphate isomerase/epimerase